MPPRTLTCVAYHHLVAEPCPATRHLSIATPPEVFRSHLDYYAAHFQVVGLDEVLSGELPERALLITIDDAYRSVLEVAAPLLAERRLPAVLFTNPRIVEGPSVPLDCLMSLVACVHGPERLRTLVPGGQMAAASVSGLIGAPVSRLGLEAREDLRRALLKALDTTDRDLARALDLFLSPRDLAGLPAYGIEVANHTASHVHCRILDAAGIATEIVECKARIEALIARPVRAFSFPYGNEQDARPAVLEALRTSGHKAQFLVHARSNRLRPAPDIWYRTSLTDEPAAVLPFKLGLMPALRTLKSASKRLISGA